MSEAVVNMPVEEFWWFLVAWYGVNFFPGDWIYRLLSTPLCKVCFFISSTLVLIWVVRLCLTIPVRALVCLGSCRGSAGCFFDICHFWESLLA